jgi:hypothetical protein
VGRQLKGGLDKSLIVMKHEKLQAEAQIAKRNNFPTQ